jgi:hypothetical protein
VIESCDSLQFADDIIIQKLSATPVYFFIAAFFRQFEFSQIVVPFLTRNRQIPAGDAEHLVTLYVICGVLMQITTFFSFFYDYNYTLIITLRLAGNVITGTYMYIEYFYKI